MQESKEKIKNRMIRNASRLWGFQETQAESSFDPLVGLIMDTLSGELAGISSEIDNTEARLLEKLVELLIPDPLTGPIPAHGILRACPVEPAFTIHPGYQFCINRKIPGTGDNPGGEKPVFYSPAGSFRLLNGHLKYLVAGHGLYGFEEDFCREILAGIPQGRISPANEIWLGLDLADDLDNLDGLSFFFDIRNEAHAGSIYESLARGRWTLNGQTLTITRGTGTSVKNSRDTTVSLLAKELDTTLRHTAHIHRFYQRQFFTLSEGSAPDLAKLRKEKFPAALDGRFHPDAVKPGRDLLWCRVEFPQVVPAEVAEELYCYINCFPVMNRHLNEFTQSAREFMNIIPLTSDETFLDMKQVTGSSGKIYTARTFPAQGETENGTYILRKGGVGRFDSRNASALIRYLLELLRDESAAFTLLGADMISSNLRELQQTIARLENRLKEGMTTKGDVAYLMLKAHQDEEALFVEFWTTNGRYGNQVKSGESLLVFEGSDLRPESVMMVTPATGGREAMDSAQKVNAFRKALLTHGRVVTAGDIKALCFEVLGDKLERVEIKKATATGQSTDHGLLEFLEISLTLSGKQQAPAPAEHTFLIRELQTRLEAQSALLLPCRITITPENHSGR